MGTWCTEGVIKTKLEYQRVENERERKNKIYNQAERIKQLQADNDRLKGKIKIICVGLDAPDFETQIKSMAEFNKGMGGSIDLNRPELAFHHGWQMAMLECGEMLSKP